MAKPGLIRKVPRKLLLQIKAIREDLHRHPELAFQEKRTAALVAEHLRALGLDEVRTGVGHTGVVGLLRGARPGPVVALRADMDALPIQEAAGRAYASGIPGVMHACGHDGHTAVLLGTASLLAANRHRLRGTVKFLFQPAEEGAGGARAMIADGALRRPRPDTIFALHGRSKRGDGFLAPGQIELAPVTHAAVSMFRIVVRGHGGHGAYPAGCVDPVVAAAQIVVAAQSIIARESNPCQPGVLTFGSFHAGTKNNIIPDQAVLQGTIRAMSLEELRKMKERLTRLARRIAAALRTSARVGFGHDDPPVRNTPAMVELVRDVGRELLGPERVLDSAEQSMGGEDFAFFLPDCGGVPGALFRLGLGEVGRIHTPHFDFGHRAIEPGILMMTNVALRFLERGAGERGR